MVAGCFLVIVRACVRPPSPTDASTQGLGTIATATGYQIGAFKLAYPHVHNMADAGMLLGGPWGRGCS